MVQITRLGELVQSHRGVESDRERPEMPCPNCRHIVFIVLSRGTRQYGRQLLPDVEECVTCHMPRHVWG